MFRIFEVPRTPETLTLSVCVLKIPKRYHPRDALDFWQYTHFMACLFFHAQVFHRKLQGKKQWKTMVLRRK